jgi:hypothetical protein
MRHFLIRILAPPRGLPRSVLARPLALALVGPSGANQRLAPPDRPAIARAVDLAPIARIADVHLTTAPSAGEDADRGRRFAINLPVHRDDRNLPVSAMAKIGRNDPCPCGSGKKHKRCCLATPGSNPAPIATATTVATAHPVEDDLCDCCLDDLNERADRALDLLVGGDIDDAEVIAKDLMRDFPREVEGIDLLSMVSEARGDRAGAASLLRRAIEIVREHPFHDAETRLLMRQRLRDLEQRA